MDAILEPIGQFWEGFLSNPIVQLASQLIVIYVVLLWLGTAYWASATCRRGPRTRSSRTSPPP